MRGHNDFTAGRRVARANNDVALGLVCGHALILHPSNAWVAPDQLRDNVARGGVEFAVGAVGAVGAVRRSASRAAATTYGRHATEPPCTLLPNGATKSLCRDGYDKCPHLFDELPSRPGPTRKSRIVPLNLPPVSTTPMSWHNLHTR